MTSYDRFQNRIDRLQSEQGACSTGLLRDLHQSAIDMTNEAATVFVELVDAFGKEAGKYEEWLEQGLQSTVAEADEAVAKLDALAAQIRSHADAVQLESEQAFWMVKARTLEARMLGFETDALRRAARVASIEALNTALFGTILGPDRKDFSLQAVKSAISFGIGVVPVVGPAVTGVAKLGELALRHPIRAKSADAHVRYLEEFIVALKGWILEAERAIRQLESSTFA